MKGQFPLFLWGTREYFSDIHWEPGRAPGGETHENGNDEKAVTGPLDF
jgi:hypothetical protein